MIQKLIPLCLVCLAAGMAGCESDRAKTPGVFPQGARGDNPRTERPLSATEVLRRAAAQPLSPVGGDGWRPIFNGETLQGWKLSGFAGAGEVECQQGMMLCHMGNLFTGVTYTNPMPVANYEVTLEVMRVLGSDFFCGLTFPVQASHCSLIVGGWGGSVVGLSSLDDQDASDNETTNFISFENGRWYRLRLRVTERSIEAWVEQKQVVDVALAGRKISLRPGDIERSAPFGLCTWVTTGAFRDIRIRRIERAGVADPESTPAR